jgi:hypothetical protein
MNGRMQLRKGHSDNAQFGDCSNSDYEYIFESALLVSKCFLE